MILAATPAVQQVVLGDGNTYEVLPLNLNMMITFKERYPDVPLEQLGTGVFPLEAFRFIMWLLLHEGVPGMTEEDAGKLLTLKVINDTEFDLGV